MPPRPWPEPYVAAEHLHAHRLWCRQPGGDQVGYGEFSDKMNASKAKNLYHGWTGWGGRGLSIEISDFGMPQMGGQQQGPPGQKRLREGEGE